MPAGQYRAPSSSGSTAGGVRLKAWWTSGVQGYSSGAAEGEAPKISLRVRINKSVVRAFLTLAVSRDGSSGGTYDKLIGGVGAGLPVGYFNVASVYGGGGPSVLVAGNTAALLQLDQLLGPKNTYYFDLSQGVGLKEFLHNEFIASQLLLGSIQSGAITLKSWVHEVTPTITLNPIARVSKPSARLSMLKRLDLEAGTNVLTLEPKVRRSVRLFGATHIKPEEVQPVRFWREGINLSVADIASGDLSQLVRAFFQLFGGAPRVYPTTIALQDYMSSGLEFGDSVTWSDTTAVTPTGIGISGTFFVIGVDLDFDTGDVNLLLLKNTLTPAVADLEPGVIAPALRVDAVTAVDATHVDVIVTPVGRTEFLPTTDFSGIFDDIVADEDFIAVDNHYQAPTGTTERVGSLEADAKVTTITTAADGTVTMRIEVDTLYQRGDAITSVQDLFVADETTIKLPYRKPAASTPISELVEAPTNTKPAAGNFASFQPRRSLIGRYHTFKRAP